MVEFLVYYSPEREWRMRGKSTDSALKRDIKSNTPETPT